jgi:hypothetical protein
VRFTASKGGGSEPHAVPAVKSDVRGQRSAKYELRAAHLPKSLPILKSRSWLIMWPSPESILVAQAGKKWRPVFAVCCPNPFLSKSETFSHRCTQMSTQIRLKAPEIICGDQTGAPDLPCFRWSQISSNSSIATASATAPRITALRNRAPMEQECGPRPQFLRTCRRRSASRRATRRLVK